MPRGVKTLPSIREQAIALVATGQNYSNTSKLLELSKNTVRQIVNQDTSLSEIRSDIETHYIIEAWQSVIAGHNELLRRLNDKDELSIVSSLELATIIEKVHRTVTAVAQNVIAIQASIHTDTTGDLDTAAWDYVASETGHTIEEAKRLLSKV